MGRDVLVIAEHLTGDLAECTFEMLGAARALASELGGDCVAGLIGGTDAMVGSLGAAARVVRVDGDGLANFNPESWGAATSAMVDASQPSVVMIANSSMGMDLASALSTAKSMPLAVSVQAVSAGDSITATCALYGGKMEVQVNLGAGPCVAAMAAGCGSPDAGKIAGTPDVQVVANGAVAGRIRFKGLSTPDAADVDITSQDVLVAVGRGIGDADGVEVAQELAEAIGGVVAASRPIIDAGWLPKSRQVGKSGLKVKPKVYLTLGISGAPEHLEGIKGASTIIAVNTDPTAPIFRIADYGLVADLYEVCEELTELVE